MNADQKFWEEAVVRLRNDPQQVALVQACFYDDPLESSALRYFESSEWCALRNLLPTEKGRALDLGAGRGIVTYALARSGWVVTAAEPNPSDIVGAGAIRSLAKAADLQIDVIESFGETLPFADSSFDLVHCRAVLHHAKNLEALCAEVARILSPSGLMIATREHVISKEADREVFLQRHPLHRFYGGENAFRYGTYVAAITNAGLKLERAFNSLETDINLFPDTKVKLKTRLSRRLRLSHHGYVPDVVLRWLGQFSRTPGRLYTFVARKRLA
jgi:SAM-dependent methyltransferase